MNLNAAIVSAPDWDDMKKILDALDMDSVESLGPGIGLAIY